MQVADGVFALSVANWGGVVRMEASARATNAGVFGLRSRRVP